MKFFPNRVLPLSLLTAMLATQSIKSKAACDENRLARAVEAATSRLGKNATQQQKMANVNLGLALARLGRTERALQIVQESVSSQDDNSFYQAEKARWHDEVLRIATRRLARRGDAKWALKTANRIRQPLPRADALFAVARLRFRQSDKTAAAKTLQAAMTLVVASKQPRVLAYGAWMMARAGDNANARRFFRLARQVPDDDAGREYDDKAQSIALYQAKAGFYDEAAKTAGNNFWAIVGVVRVLDDAQQFERAFKLVEQIPDKRQRDLQKQNIVFKAAESGQRPWAARQIPQLQEQSAQTPSASDEAVFALLYAFVGEMKAAQELFARYEMSPTAQPEDIIMFYMAMIRTPAIRLRLSSEQLAEYLVKAKNAALQMPLRERARLLFLIAEVQQQQGMKAEMMETLSLADVAARQQLASSGDVNDSNDLLQIATLWRQSGHQTETRAALSFISQSVKQQTSVAYFVASQGFWPESLRILQLKPFDNAENYRGFAQLQTQKNGGDPLLWISKLKSASNRAAALSGATEGCEPQNAEERELVLSANGYSSRG